MRDRLTEIEQARAVLRARREGLQEAFRFCYRAMQALDTEITATHEAWDAEYRRLYPDSVRAEAGGCTHGPPASAGELPGIE